MGIFSKKDKTEDLSHRWIQEGKQFTDQLNGFLDAIYKGGDGPEEPQETRADMAQSVYETAVKLNENGEHKKLRELFPPAYEPFEPYYQGISRSVNQIIVQKNGDIIARADGNIYLDNGTVFLLQDDKITEQSGIMAFGISANKKYMVKITDSSIQIHNDWNDAPVWTTEYPSGYGEAASKYPVTNFEEEGLIVLSAEVFNDGKRVLLTTTNDIFILSENDNLCLFPTQEMIPHFIENYYEEYEDDVPFEISLEYLHAKLSNDNTKIAAGFQSSNHFIFEADGKDFKATGTVQARSEYPHSVAFHDTLNHVALASCHYQKSGVVGMDLSNLPIDANASWHEAFDERLDPMHDNMWVFSILPYKEGYLLGANNGYIWFIDPKNPENKAYLHVGGTIMCMDYPIDKKYLVIGTFSGYVIKFDLTATERDKSLVTDMNIKETNRWVMWIEKAMIW